MMSRNYSSQVSSITDRKGLGLGIYNYQSPASIVNRILDQVFLVHDPALDRPPVQPPEFASGPPENPSTRQAIKITCWPAPAIPQAPRMSRPGPF